MSDRILYLGDTAIDQAAGYLAGIMTHYGFDFDYVDSSTQFSDSLLENEYGLMIISDYPASNFSAEQIKAIAEKTKSGMSLMMIGGWESFTGFGGDYNNTAIADVLPVVMKDSDDRVNFSGPCMVNRQTDHQILAALPFESDVPTVGGLNEFTAKPDADVLLKAVSYKAEKTGGKVVFTENGEYPLLVIDESHGTRTAAFASDVAPHWVGPLVDWGGERLRAKAKDAEEIEVGSDYAKLFANIIKWLCRK